MRPQIRAAGAVLWRRDARGALEVALVHRPRYDDWSLPKGKLDEGETDEQAALREVEEETGHTGDLGAPLGEVRYLQTRWGRTAEKVVTYWAMEARAGVFAASDEVDVLRWLPPQEARELLSYERDREVLDRLPREPAAGI